MLDSISNIKKKIIIQNLPDNHKYKDRNSNHLILEPLNIMDTEKNPQRYQ